MKCCELSAGKLRHPIAIERKVTIPDPVGGGLKTWQTLLKGKAKIKPLSGNEFLHSDRLEARLTHRLWLRWFDGLLSSDRITFKNRYFQIRAIINLEERNKWYELHCEEGVAQ